MVGAPSWEENRRNGLGSHLLPPLIYPEVTLNNLEASNKSPALKTLPLHPDDTVIGMNSHVPLRNTNNIDHSNLYNTPLSLDVLCMHPLFCANKKISWLEV